MSCSMSLLLAGVLLQFADTKYHLGVLTDPFSCGTNIIFEEVMVEILSRVNYNFETSMYKFTGKDLGS
jgi:hypothetical protein